MVLTFLLTAIIFPSVAQHSIQFDKTRLTDRFISEGAAVGDVNKDGLTDVMAGAHWFEAPNWEMHEITESQEFSPTKGYSNSFLNFSMDVNQDGWIDHIRVGWPGEEVVWYENPKNKPGHWTMHEIHDHLGNESPRMIDIDGDGRPDLLGNDPVKNQIIWLKAPAKKGDTEWEKFVISKEDNIPGVHKYTHGLGMGDMNNDGFEDVIITKGWWENPGDPTKENWTFHPENLGQDCAQMYYLDLNQDGQKDLLSSSAHNYGIWWHENVSSNGTTSWEEHLIDSSFSQTHALVMEDINQDGNIDFITGKRHFAHNGGDPGGHDPAVVYWYEYQPGKNPQWIPHPIDDNSGVGLIFTVTDLNKDGLLDIVTANKKGVFIFIQNRN